MPRPQLQLPLKRAAAALAGANSGVGRATGTIDQYYLSRHCAVGSLTLQHPLLNLSIALNPNLNLKVGSVLYSNQLSRSMYLMDTVSPRTAGLKDCLLTLAMLPPSHILDVCNTSLYPGAIPYPLAVAEVLPWWDLS